MQFSWKLQDSCRKSGRYKTGVFNFNVKCLSKTFYLRWIFSEKPIFMKNLLRHAPSKWKLKLDHFSWNSQISNFINIHSAIVECFISRDELTDGQTDGLNEFNRRPAGLRMSLNWLMPKIETLLIWSIFQCLACLTLYQENWFISKAVIRLSPLLRRIHYHVHKNPSLDVM
jgi:hypothetical protein